MPSSGSHFSSDATRLVIPRVLVALRTKWQQGELPDIWQTLESDGTLSQAELLEVLLADQAEHWRRHQPVLIERYFEKRPELLSHEASATKLILGEIALRRSIGQTPTLKEYVVRFPILHAALVKLFESSDASAVNLEQTILPTEQATPKPSRSLDETCVLPTPQVGNLVQDQTLISPAPFQPIDPFTPETPEFPNIPGYTITEELGRGGMGVVYRARQVRADREVALKIIRPDTLALMPSDTRSNTVGRFRHEAKAAARLLHDNIVTVYEVGEWNTYNYYAMRMVQGPSLIQLIRERPLENRLAAKYIAATARGVFFAHENGILHRDLKPHNVLIDASTQRALVADFGLAKFTADSDELTRAGDVIGTPSYMSPEQARDSSTVTTQSDVYSLGATLYHVITGRPPFQAANLGETIRQIIHDEPLSPRTLNPAIHADLETICLKCLHKEPFRRYATAAAFADDLDRYLNGEPIQARPVSLAEKGVRWCRRNPALSSSLGAVILLAVIAVSAIVAGYRNSIIEGRRTKAALTKAEERLKAALAVVDDLFTKVSEDRLLMEPGMQKLRRDLLLRAKDHYQSFLADNIDNTEIQEELANAHFRVGLIHRELSEYEQALQALETAEKIQRQRLDTTELGMATQRALSDTLNLRGELLALTNQYNAADAAYREALQFRDALAKANPTEADLLRKQANSHMNLGNLLMRQRNAACLNEFETAQKIRQTFLQQHADNALVKRDFAQGAFNIGGYLGNKYLTDFDNMTEAEQDLLLTQAQQQLNIAVTIFQTFAEQEPRDMDNRLRLSRAYRLLADIASEPAPLYEQGLNVISQLAKDNPDVEKYKLEEASVLAVLGGFALASKDFSQANARFAEADKVLQTIKNHNEEACENLARLHFAWSESLVNSNREESRFHLELALKFWREFMQNYSTVTQKHKEIAQEEMVKIAKLLKNSEQVPTGDASKETPSSAEK